jgi:transposase
MYHKRQHSTFCPEAIMSLHAQPLAPIPTDTARVAKAAFRRKGNLYLTIGDRIGPLFEDVDFSDLYGADGAPALSPNLLALVVVFAFIEDLSDREAAEAVLSRIDWKYALHLSLTDPGFDQSVLHDFRQRLLRKEAAVRMFDRVLTRLAELGLVRPRGQQRSDGSYVLAATHHLSRLELVCETMAVALEALADDHPAWLRAIAQSHWYERYSQEWASARLPKGKEQRSELGRAVAADGCYLLEAVMQPTAPPHAGELPAVNVLRQVWEQQFEFPDGQVQWRAPEKIPPGAQLILSPHDPEARFSQHGDHTWEGYAVHWTESCDDDLPHLITDAQTVSATTPDIKVLPDIHAQLAKRQLLPAQHLVDQGYMAGHSLVKSREDYGIELIGRLPAESSWQAQQPEGLTTDQFQIDWVRQQVLCPQGQTSRYWSAHDNEYGQPVVDIQFAQATCATCPLRQRCTHATTTGRILKVSIYHDAILAARERQRTPQFRATYARRSGIEGTVSESVHHGARRTRYIGLAKTHVQTLLTAIAINLKRAALWFMGRPRAATRPSRLRCLRPAQLAV